MAVKCASCGARLPKNGQFCPTCYTPVSPSAPAPIAAPSAVPAGSASQSPAPHEQGQAAAATVVPRRHIHPRRRVGTRAVAALVGVGLVAFIGVGILVARPWDRSAQAPVALTPIVVPKGLPVHVDMVQLAGDGHLLIGDQIHKVVWLANLTATPVTLYGQTIAPGGIARVAGDGQYSNTPRSYSGDGGPATRATSGDPGSLAVDGTHNLFIDDDTYGLVHEVDARTGIITTILNTSKQGLGMGGVTLTTDATGALFIASSPAEQVFKLDAQTQALTAVAGGGQKRYDRDGVPATQAQLFAPTTVAIDRSGTLFIGEEDRVRRVDGRTGIITTVPGTGTPLSPSGLSLGAVDSADHLYGIAYDKNIKAAVVQEVNPSTGAVTTVAGTAHTSANDKFGSGDGGPATKATLDTPSTVAIDSAGNIFIADSGLDRNNLFGSDLSHARVREVDKSTGIIRTVVGL